MITQTNKKYVAFSLHNLLWTLCPFEIKILCLGIPGILVTFPALRLTLKKNWNLTDNKLKLIIYFKMLSKWSKFKLPSELIVLQILDT